MGKKAQQESQAEESTVKTVRLTRSEEDAARCGQPGVLTADVHPDEVDSIVTCGGGWMRPQS